jgi:MoaE-MoaD fusion protein
MAESKLLEIVTAAAQRHGLCSAAAEHRIGTVGLSEPSVVVAASAPHREEAFASAREIIDQIKLQVPIWKREEGTWLGSEPPTGAGPGLM